MRIAVDAACIESLEPTGVEQAAQELLDALGRLKGPDDRLLVFTRHVEPVAATAEAGLELHALGGSARPAIWRETRLAAALEEHGADVLWSPVTAMPVRTGVPVVATVHELPWRVRRGMEGFVRERLQKVRLAQTVRRAARVVCPSEWTRQQVLAEHPGVAERLVVVPHGVRAAWVLRKELRDLAAGLRGQLGGAEGGYLLHVGGNRPRKNLPLLLEGFRRYRGRGGRLGLLLVGPGNAPDDLPAGAEFLGYVEGPFVLSTFDASAALVVTSESEGFGLPVLEAFARSRPVLSVRQGALVETAGDAALLVDPDPDSLAAGMRRIANDTELRAELVERGRARAREFTWERSATRLLAVLRQAAGVA